MKQDRKMITKFAQKDLIENGWNIKKYEHFDSNKYAGWTGYKKIKNIEFTFFRCGHVWVLNGHKKDECKTILRGSTARELFVQVQNLNLVDVFKKKKILKVRTQNTKMVQVLEKMQKVLYEFEFLGQKM